MFFFNIGLSRLISKPPLISSKNWAKTVKSSNDSLTYKAKIKGAALRFFCFYNGNSPQNLSDEELKALEKLSG